MRTLLTASATVCFLAMSGFTGAASAADIKVLSDGPLRSALTVIADRFQRETEHKVQLWFGTAPALKTRIMGGEAADLLITTGSEAEEVTKQGKLNAEGQAVVARVGVGLAIREGVPVPDVSTLDALKETLLRADSLVFGTLASGNHFLKVAERLGILEDVKGKSTQLPSGSEVFDELLKRNGRDLAIGSITQIMEYARNGLRLVGPLPADVQLQTVYAAGVLTNAKAPDAAREFLRYLRSPESQAAFAAAGAS